MPIKEYLLNKKEKSQCIRACFFPQGGGSHVPWRLFSTVSGGMALLMGSGNGMGGGGEETGPCAQKPVPLWGNQSRALVASPFRCVKRKHRPLDVFALYEFLFVNFALFLNRELISYKTKKTEDRGF